MRATTEVPQARGHGRLVPRFAREALAWGTAALLPGWPAPQLLGVSSRHCHGKPGQRAPGAALRGITFLAMLWPCPGSICTVLGCLHWVRFHAI